MFLHVCWLWSFVLHVSGMSPFCLRAPTHELSEPWVGVFQLRTPFTLPPQQARTPPLKGSCDVRNPPPSPHTSIVAKPEPPISALRSASCQAGSQCRPPCRRLLSRLGLGVPGLHCFLLDSGAQGQRKLQVEVKQGERMFQEGFPTVRSLREPEPYLIPFQLLLFILWVHCWDSRNANAIGPSITIIRELDDTSRKPELLEHKHGQELPEQMHYVAWLSYDMLLAGLSVS